MKTQSNGNARLIVAASDIDADMLYATKFWAGDPFIFLEQNGKRTIVLSDLASTAYYIGGITEHAVGKAAPWFVLGVMLFASAVRAVYVESCAMFVEASPAKRCDCPAICPIERAKSVISAAPSLPCPASSRTTASVS